MRGPAVVGGRKRGGAGVEGRRASAAAPDQRPLLPPRSDRYDALYLDFALNITLLAGAEKAWLLLGFNASVRPALEQVGRVSAQAAASAHAGAGAGAGPGARAGAGVGAGAGADRGVLVAAAARGVSAFGGDGSLVAAPPAPSYAVFWTAQPREPGDDPMFLLDALSLPGAAAWAVRTTLETATAALGDAFVPRAWPRTHAPCHGGAEPSDNPRARPPAPSFLDTAAPGDDPRAPYSLVVAGTGAPGSTTQPVAALLLSWQQMLADSVPALALPSSRRRSLVVVVTPPCGPAAAFVCAGHTAALLRPGGGGGTQDPVQAGTRRLGHTVVLHDAFGGGGGSGPGWQISVYPTRAMAEAALKVGLTVPLLLSLFPVTFLILWVLFELVRFHTYERLIRSAHGALVYAAVEVRLQGRGLGAPLLRRAGAACKHARLVGGD